jgi:prevent-host-death family protein
MEMSIREMRQQLTQLQVVLEKTPEIIITRRGKPLARLVPITKSRKRPDHAKLRAMQPRMRLGSEVLIRADRDER